MCYYIIYAPQWLIHFVTDIEEVFDASNPQKLFHVREGRISEAFPNVDTAFRLFDRARRKDGRREIVFCAEESEGRISCVQLLAMCHGKPSCVTWLS